MTRLALGPGAQAGPRSLRFTWNRTGDLVSLPRSGSGSAPARRLVSPGGRVLPFARERTSLLLEEAGLYRLEGGDEPVYVAANLLSAGESDLTVRADAAGTAPLPPPPGPARGRLPLQPGLALLSLLSLLASVLLFLRRERGWARVLPLLLLCLAAGCPEGDSPRGRRKELAPGRRVEVAAPAEKKGGEPCESCGAVAGEGHRCGLSRFCPDCGVERSLAVHVCGVSRFCPDCGKERSLLAHRCGETAFCPVCLSEVPLPHEHLKGPEPAEKD
jgi:hypothetical protein